MRGDVVAEVLVLGAGFGGAACAIEAAAALGTHHHVTIIDRDATSHLCGANPFLVVGERSPEGVTRRTESIDGPGITSVVAEINEIDVGSRQVGTSAGDFGFDYLVVALGAGYDWDATPGSSGAHSFYDHTSAVNLRTRLQVFEGGSIAVAVAAAPIKCPPAPFEAAMVIDWDLRRRGLRAQSEIHVCIPEPAPMGVAGPEATAKMRAALEERRIVLHTSAGVVAVDGDEVSLSNGTSVTADVPVVVPRHQIPAVVADSGLTNGKPWIPVDAATLETSAPGIFAIGDNVMIPVGDKAVPKAGVFAAGQGRTAARVIASRVLEADPPPAYDGFGHCLIAFSGEEAARIGGEFLAAGGPDVGLQDPDAQTLSAKEEFEERWRAFSI